MKANRKFQDDEQGFSFIVPMTLAIVVGFALLIAGAYVIGVLSSSLEASYPDNTSTWTSGENETSNLMGNITGGFGDVVDIEIVVIIITAISMAILAIMAIAGRTGY